MKRWWLVGSSLCLCIAAAFAVSATTTPAQGAASDAQASSHATSSGISSVDQNEPYYEACAREGLNASECAGRLIWYKATAGNSRFHTYTFQQRIGVLIDWFRVLNAESRDDRFWAWGIINDPSCCKPGDSNCPAKSLEETYGFDWCPGDDQLLKYVGRPGYRDPACDFKDARLEEADPHSRGGTRDQRQSACDLAFGTSTGALGLRKFPNPRFNPGLWRKVNGTMASWTGYNKKLSEDKQSSDYGVSHLLDISIEPPFLIGMSCGSCHIAFDPLNPPKDPAHPRWENIKGAVGNQYSHMSEILVSGMRTNSLEWQVFAHARAGTTDTSAVPTDQLNNPGTINAVINTNQRPVHDEVINKWRKVGTVMPEGSRIEACKQGEPEELCWCEPGRDNKCWRKSVMPETVHHILKGAEDSIGAMEAIQRVYFNIGSCSEQCWVNHLTDLGQLDPQRRNFGQTAFNIGQCRRDCPNFRAIEDRLHNILDFLRSSEASATDLSVARENALKRKNPEAIYTRDDLVADLEQEFGAGSVSRGKAVFANNCARCHSSLPESQYGAFGSRDFYKVSDKTGLRLDWLGNDEPTKASEVRTFRCRALHSNHMAGHIWQEYGSETLRARPPDPNLPESEENKNGGRSYYRNISLINLWAFAPFMHNNAVGPEVCGMPANKANDFYRQRYVDANGHALPPDKEPGCVRYDPSVEGRFDLYKKSMQTLLNPRERTPKITKLTEDVVIDIGPKLWDGKEEHRLFGFSVVIPAGLNAGDVGNFQHKQFIDDLVLAKTKPELLEARRGKEVAREMREIAAKIASDPAQMVKLIEQHGALVRGNYISCTADIENAGHPFGEDLTDADKKALIAFLATL